MSSVLATQLARLYRDYYAGRLEFSDYRHRRSLLLNSLSPGSEDEEEGLETQPRPAAILEPVAEPVPEKPVQQGDRRSFSLVSVVAICVVVVIVVVFAVVRQLGEPDFEPAAVVPETEQIELPYSLPDVEEAEVTEISRTPEVGQALVEDFVQRQDWRLLSLQEFRDSWGRIAASDRIVAKGTIWFRPMTQSLQEQIDEALAVAVDPDNDEVLDQLYEFSLVLGLIEQVPPGWVPSEDSSISAGAAVEARDASVAADLQNEIPETEAFSEPAPGNGAGSPATAADNSSTPSPADDAGMPDAAVGPDAVNTTPRTGSAGNCSTDLLKTRRRTCYDFIAPEQRGPAMRVLPGGAFVMGSDEKDDSNPRHEAEIPTALAVSVFEITRSEYELFCQNTGHNCSEDPWSNGAMPVVNVSWNDAAAYAGWLSDTTGQSYRLPNEEEWEYATRGGTETNYPFGDKLLPAQARYSAIRALDRPLPKTDQTTQRNPFGLWHVVGNVQEWVANRWESDYSGGNGDNNTVGPGGGELRVVRGGSYADKAGALRSSARVPMQAQDKNTKTGFRVVRDF